jgi:hypothetical protein
VQEALEFYFDYDAAIGADVPHGLATSPAAAQATYGDFPSQKSLVEKIAGNDAVGQHADWSTDFVGWGPAGSTTPEGLVRDWFVRIDALAQNRANGAPTLAPDGSPVSAVHITPQGHDLSQLLQKFLLGAVAFSQGADDYLDDDLPGKGLLADHTALVDGAPYTEVEHAWDEGFGYFGASRDYGLLDAADVAEDPSHDTDGDGAIDLLSEYSHGHSANAAKRDAGAVTTTDHAGQAWRAFRAGRQLLADRDGALDDDDLATLREHRDQAIEAWEAAIAATVVHYINEVLRDEATLQTADYDFEAHAKHWSELKGFALAFQFNRRSPLDSDDFAALHTLIGDAPALAGAAPELRQARALVGDAFGFDAANLGDDGGHGGW